MTVFSNDAFVDDTLDLPLTLRKPVREDGQHIHALIQACPPLDVNSVYAYMLLCEHFPSTCIVAQGEDGLPDGFISGYVPPGRADVLFIWQVAVHERARGRRLAQHMLDWLLSRPALASIKWIETTVGPDNAASRKTFAAMANQFGASIKETELFPPHLFGEAAHDDERLLRIGPLLRD
ncbi:MAG: diaminobutyrate acetyltransferase [Burkholderiaceae bacterium]